MLTPVARAAQVLMLSPPVTFGFRSCTSFLPTLHTHTLTQCILVYCFNTKGLPSVQLLQPTNRTLIRSSTHSAALAAVTE